MWTQLTLLAVTVAAVAVVRRRWQRIVAWPYLSAVYPLAHLLWLLLVVVVLSHSVAAIADIPFLWGAIGKLLTLGVLLVWPVAVTPTRAIPWVAGGLALALAFLGLCDLAYWRHFGGLFPLTAFMGSGQAWDIRESIAAVLRASDFWLLPTALASVVVIAGVPRASGNHGRRWLCVGVGVVVLVGLGVMHHNLTGSRARKVLSHARWSRHVGVYGVHVLDTARIAGEWWRRGNLTDEMVSAVHGYLERDRQQRPTPTGSELFGVARGSNILIVQLESVQGFVIGARVGDFEVTPFLNSLTESAAYYPLITDQSGEANTADTEYLVHNSQHPMRQGAVVFRRPDNEFVTWTQLLRDSGYTTLSAHPWDRGFWNRAIVHPRYGFERMLFRRELGGIIDPVGWGSSDRAFYQRMVPVLRELDGPFVAYLITLMSHHPYTFYPPNRRQADLGGLEESMLGAYLHLMREVDLSLRHFVEELTVAGALDDTILVIFGDHDARLAFPSVEVEEGSRALGVSVDQMRHVSGRDPRADFVPLFIRLPGGQLRGTIPVAGGQLDIGPTLLFLLGVEAPSAFLGRPLIPGAEGFAARIDGSVIDNQRMFVSQGVDVPAEGLCLSSFDRAELSREACRDLTARADEQLQTSWRITELNMARLLDEVP